MIKIGAKMIKIGAKEWLKMEVKVDQTIEKMLVKMVLMASLVSLSKFLNQIECQVN